MLVCHYVDGVTVSVSVCWLCWCVTVLTVSLCWLCWCVTILTCHCVSVSLSEGSEETGDERQNQHKQKKKRSLRSKKKKQALQTSLVTSPPWSDSDLLTLPTGQFLYYLYYHWLPSASTLPISCYELTIVVFGAALAVTPAW